MEFLQFYSYIIGFYKCLQCVLDFYFHGINHNRFTSLQILLESLSIMGKILLKFIVYCATLLVLYLYLDSWELKPGSVFHFHI